MSLLPELNEAERRTLEGMRFLAETQNWKMGSTLETAEFLRQALKVRTRIVWSVTNARGTAYGWLRIRARKNRAANEYGNLTEADILLLREALGFHERDHEVGRDGVSIPSSNDYYQEYVQRALGVAVTIRGKQYWD